MVDDRIPVYEHNLEPIWGLSYDRPWEIILIKAWAKKLQGYSNIKNSQPFVFVESFSNSNWKFYNLSREGKKFLHFYADRYQHGRIFLKTKNSKEVKDSGLIPNECAYELMGINKDQ